MDDYMFREHVSNCRQVTEATHYVEILNYSVSAVAFMMVLWGDDMDSPEGRRIKKS